MAGAGGNGPSMHLGEVAAAFAANALIACGQFLTIISLVQWVEKNADDSVNGRDR